MTNLQLINTDKIPPRFSKPRRLYTEKDYKGSLNINLAEKGLIIQAAAKYNGDRYLMALALKIHVRTLFYKIQLHNLDQQL